MRKPMTNLVVCSNSKIFRRYWESFYKDNPQFKRGSSEIGFMWIDSSNGNDLTRFYLNEKLNYIRKLDRDINVIFLRRYQSTNPKRQYFISEIWLYIYMDWKRFGYPIVSDKKLNTDNIDDSFAEFRITDAKNMIFE